MIISYVSCLNITINNSNASHTLWLVSKKNDGYKCQRYVFQYFVVSGGKVFNHWHWAKDQVYRLHWNRHFKGSPCPLQDWYSKINYIIMWNFTSLLREGIPSQTPKFGNYLSSVLWRVCETFVLWMRCWNFKKFILQLGH